MAVVFDELNTVIPITASAAAHLTASASTTYHVVAIWLHNTHSEAIEVTIYKVPNATGSLGTAGSGNQIYKKTLDAYQTVCINDGPMYLNAENDSIQAVAGTASKVNIFIQGAKQT